MASKFSDFNKKPIGNTLDGFHYVAGYDQATGKNFTVKVNELYNSLTYAEIPITNRLTVTVNHNLEKIPTVIILDNNGYEVLASIQHNMNTKNSFTITFSVSFSGTIIYKL